MLGQTILLPPRLALWVAFTPARAVSRANERHHIYERFRSVWFNDEGTVGLYPTARIQSGFGLTVGGRFVHRDLAGHGEKAALYAGYGGRYRNIAQLSLRSGRLLGERVSLETDAEYEQRPKERFYGIGNDDEVSPPDVPVDPLMYDAAIETRYRQRLARVRGTGDLRVVGPLHLRLAGALTDYTFGRSEVGSAIDEVYMPDRLIGWDGVRHGYGEVELLWDDRGVGSEWDSPARYSNGSLLSLYGGRVHRLDEGEDFYRYGTDLQHFFRLGAGPRVLSVRGHAEAVSAPVDDVPFVDLPHLGRTMYLRGYPTERFRDRVAAAGSVEYEWDLWRTLAASVFVDAGRVFPSWRDATFRDLRVGYGSGLAWYGRKSLRLRLTVASSIDGGVFVDVSFDPVTELDGRVERR